MKTGKLPENALKRSVLRQIYTGGETVQNGAGIGRDCAILAFGGNGGVAACVQEGMVRMPEEAGEGAAAGEPAMTMGDLIQKCANNLAAGGARPLGAMVALLLPESAQETDVKALMAEAAEKCRTLGMEIAGGQTRTTAGASSVLAAVTGFGRMWEHASAKGAEKCGIGEAASEGKARGTWACGRRAPVPGQDIVLSKWIGLEGTALLARRNRAVLLERYPAYLVEEAEGFGRYLSVVPEAQVAAKFGAGVMHDASEGGIFGALWELAEGAGVGLSIDLQRIPLRQETVEVCECCGVNPYELLAGGCLIMTAEDGPGLAAALEREGIPAALVGKITEGNDRILLNGDEIRYMDRPKRDGIYVFEELSDPSETRQLAVSSPAGSEAGHGPGALRRDADEIPYMTWEREDIGVSSIREELLKVIEKNSRIDLGELAVLLGTEEAEVANELAALEAEGIICAYHTLIDWEKTSNEKVTALIEVRVTPQRGQGFDSIAERIYRYPEVKSCYLISGGYDLMVILEEKSLRDVSAFVSDKLSTLESVLSTATHFILKKYKDHGTVLGWRKEDEREMITP